MAIREKSSIIEFSYDCSEGESFVTYEMKYDAKASPDQEITIAQVYSDRADSITCPVNLLVEIVQFLKSKNVIGNSNFVGAGPFATQLLGGNTLTRNASKNTTLPLPVVQRKDQPDISPVTSFDVENPQEVEEVQKVAEVIVKNSEPSDDNIKIGNNTTPEITPEDEKIMKERMVIRSRVSDPENNPLEAEREGAMIRDSVPRKKEKKIRKL